MTYIKTNITNTTCQTYRNFVFCSSKVLLKYSKTVSLLIVVPGIFQFIFFTKKQYRSHYHQNEGLESAKESSQAIKMFSLFIVVQPKAYAILVPSVQFYVSNGNVILFIDTEFNCSIWPQVVKLLYWRIIFNNFNIWLIIIKFGA